MTRRTLSRAYYSAYTVRYDPWKSGAKIAIWRQGIDIKRYPSLPSSSITATNEPPLSTFSLRDWIFMNRTLLIRSCCTPRGIYGLFSQVKRGRVTPTWSTHLKKRHPPWRRFRYFAVSQYRDKSRWFAKLILLRTISSKTSSVLRAAAIKRRQIPFDSSFSNYRGYHS